jgi:oleate hydratase
MKKVVLGKKRSERNAYLVGGGIASLASAAYLIRDGHMSGKNIHVFEESEKQGGALDAQNSPEKGYVMRGGRMFEEHYGCTYDLLSFIPSLDNPKKSVTDEITIFNKKIKTYAEARLVRDGKKLDMQSLGFSEEDRVDFIKLIATPEDALGTQRINEWFKPTFFKTNFWFFYCTTFAFEPWHSLVEFRRYLLRFIHLFPGDGLRHLTGIWRTPKNQYESIVLPLITWLKKKGVVFEMDSRVMGLDFKSSKMGKRVIGIRYLRGGKQEKVALGRNDFVFVTNGSMTADSTYGSMSLAPILQEKKTDGAWKLWESIAKESSEFGHPEVFDAHIPESKWESFSLTFKSPLFFDLMEKFTSNEAGTGGLVTFTDSNWLMSVVLAHQPHFDHQPKGIFVGWAYGLFPDKIGNYVKKKMSDCTGEEFLIELCHHLKFEKDISAIVKSAIIIPCMMPYITSQFLVRAKGDRPLVVPKNSENLAFIGQYAEVPDDCVFTVEYSIRTAQTAVYTLLGLDKKPTPIYRGQYDIKVLFDAFKTMHE